MAYYSRDLALVHDRGFGQHADRCAPGILELLSPVSGGLVLELGCGSGALTRHLLAAGHRVIATDASADMLSLARAALGEDVDLRPVTLPGDPLPAADAIVSVGHVISYLPDAAAIDQALVSMAGALRPGGVLAIDICDLEFGKIRAGLENVGQAGRTGPSSPTSPRRRRTGTSVISPRSSPTAQARGGAVASGTRTCSSTRPGYRRCWPTTVCRPRWGRGSATRSCRPGCAR